MNWEPWTGCYKSKRRLYELLFLRTVCETLWAKHDTKNGQIRLAHTEKCERRIQYQREQNSCDLLCH